MNCPNCQSEQIRKLSVVYEEGLAQFNARTESLATGSGGSAWGTSATEGVSQTALSQKAAPPKKESVIKLALMFFVGMFVFGIILSLFLEQGSFLIGVLMLGYIAMAIFTLYKTFIYNIREFPGVYAEWQRSYMCMQCGTVFPTN